MGGWYQFTEHQWYLKGQLPARLQGSFFFPPVRTFISTSSSTLDRKYITLTVISWFSYMLVAVQGRHNKNCIVIFIVIPCMRIKLYFLHFLPYFTHVDILQRQAWKKRWQMLNSVMHKANAKGTDPTANQQVCVCPWISLCAEWIKEKKWFSITR